MAMVRSDRSAVASAARFTALAAAALAASACLGSTDPVRARSAELALHIAASTAPPPGDGARLNVVTPASIDVSITAPIGGVVAELLRTSIAPDSAGRRLPVRVDLGSCLGDGRATCALSVMVRLRAASGVAYDSSRVGPFDVSPGGAVEVPPIRFRSTARLDLLDPVLNIPLGRTGTVRVNAIDSSSQLLVGRALAWRSLDPAIATVDGNGVVNALTQGRARIEAAREGLTVTSLVNATPVEALQLTASAARVMAGTPVTLSHAITVQGGRTNRVQYGSSDPTIAQVDTAGRVTTLRAGVVRLSVTAVADTTQRAEAVLTVDLFRAASSVRFVETGARGTLAGHVWDVVARTADSVFAMACGTSGQGQLLRFDGTEWRPVGPSTSPCARGLTRTRDGTLWAAGGGIARFANGIWRTETLPTAEFLFDVAAVADTVYAVGSAGSILRWNGAWTVMPSGVTGTLRTVSAALDGTVLAAGDNGVLLRLVNGTWRPVTTGVTLSTISGIAALSANEIYVGGATASGFVTQVFTGNAWLVTAISQLVPAALRAFVAVGAERYAISDVGDVFRLSGTTWQFAHATGMANATLVGGSGWIVGAGWHGSSWQWSGGAWRRLSNVPSYTALWAGSPTFMLAGGSEASVDLFDGTAWRQIKAPDFRFIGAIFGIDTTEVWVGASRMFYRYRAGVWDSVPHAAPNIRGIWGARRDRLWAVGSGGEILRYDGTTWLVETRVGASLFALTGMAQPDGSVLMYAAGSGRVYRSTGTSWTEEAVPRATVITDLYLPDTATVYAVSTSGVPLQRVAGIWRDMATGAPTGAYWIKGTGPTDLYAGTCSTVHHYDGTRWTAMNATGTTTPPICFLGGGSAAVLRSGGLVVGHPLRTILTGVGPRGEAPGVPR